MKRFFKLWLQFLAVVGGLALFSVALTAVADWALARFDHGVAFAIYMAAVATMWAIISAIFGR